MIASLVLKAVYLVIGLVRFYSNGVHNVASYGLNLPSYLCNLLYDMPQATGGTQVYVCNDLVH
jgi:hypothetical protein